MITSIIKNKKSVLPAQADYTELWDQIRSIWKTHDAALTEIGRLEAAAFRNIITNLLTTTKNNTFSPNTILCGLLFLSSLCDGPTKKEILSSLFCYDREPDTIARTIQTSITCESVAAVCTMANSLWIEESAPIHIEQIKELGKKYRADIFSGSMGTFEMDTAIQQWVGANTGGALEEHTAGITTTKDMLIKMLLTTYFRSDWDNKFWSEKTKKDVFHVSKDTDIQCDFMNCQERTLCHCGQQYVAFSKELQLDYRMWFVLPATGVSLNDLVGNKSVNLVLTRPADLPLTEYDVTMSIPKFDISSNLDIKTKLQKMGINAVFSETDADFSPVIDSEKVYLSSVDHAARIKVDEDGIEAAAYMDLSAVAACIPPKVKRIVVKLNRPFLFAISKSGKVPIYVGTVANPLDT